MASLAHYFGWAGEKRVEPGDSRDRCSHCGGWISMGHAKGSACQEPPQTAEEVAGRAALNQQLTQKGK